MLKVISFICIILLLAMIFVAIESVIECSKIKITKYTLKSSHVNDKLKLVMMADLHNCNRRDDNKKMLDAIRNEAPDVIILAGDMIVSHSDQGEDNKKTAGFIEKLSSIAPVYYGVGNHEKRAIISEKKLVSLWKEYISVLNNNENIHLLQNKKERIVLNDTPVSISGLDLHIDYYKRFVEKKLTREDVVSFVTRETFV